MSIFLKANEVVSQRVRDGNACVRAYVRTLDNSHGVYRMLDEKDCVLYVGKAKNLKKRVSSYSRPTGHSNRIIRMIICSAQNVGKVLKENFERQAGWQAGENQKAELQN